MQRPAFNAGFFCLRVRQSSLRRNMKLRWLLAAAGGKKRYKTAM
jgi:hypothetical protein